MFSCSRPGWTGGGLYFLSHAADGPARDGGAQPGHATGSAIPSVVSTWQPISAAPREVVPLQATAPSPDAVDFRFYVQAERR